MAFTDNETQMFADGIILEFENPQKVGFDEDKGLWFPHDSVEGGTKTLAYGHKLTKREETTGHVLIGGNYHKISDGISEDLAIKLYEKDKQDTVEGLERIIPKQVTDNLNAQQKGSIVSLVYNTGLSTFKNSNAYQNLVGGNVKGFIVEAFDPQQGFVKGGGKTLKGLQRRRKMEATMFTAEESTPTEALLPSFNRTNPPNFHQPAAGLVRPFRSFTANNFGN